MTWSLGPLRLRADNFTAPQRTPWGGTRILREHKAALGLPYPHGTIVGESWELSAGVELPSATDAGRLLPELLAAAPSAMLGEEAARGRTTSALVVKWLDAADDLSLQIHPENDSAELEQGEGGKVEAWYVVAHEPDAALYLGFREGVDEAAVRDVLQRGADLSALMAKRAVQRGDLFLLEPGTPHAVGRGITLIEPQLVDPARRAMTYRYWDWNRRYDETGVPSPHGAPRALHVDKALRCTRWERASDPRWLDSRVRHFDWPSAHGPARCETLCGPDASAALDSSALRIARLVGEGEARLPGWNALRSVTVLEGVVELGAGPAAVHVPAGMTAAVPAGCGPLDVRLTRAHAVVCAVAS